MRSSLAVLLLVLLLHLCGVSKPVHAEFLQVPEDVTAALGTNATFHCSHTTAEVVWRVNNIQLSTPAALEDFAEQRKVFVTTSEDMTMTTLIALASVDNNQSTILCLAFISGSNPLLSVPATLTVFGLPSPPTSLAVSVNAAKQLRLTWEPPSTIPGEDITYYVEVENLNTTSTFVSDILSNTEYIFNQPPEDEDCDQYKFTVFTVNAVGSSEPSDSETSTIPVVPGAVTGVSTTVSLDGGVSVTFEFESPDVCPDYPVLTYNITARNMAGVTILLGEFSSTGTMETFITNSSIGLNENTEYTATVVAENIVGSSMSPGVTFYTSDVQTARVQSPDSQRLQVTCTFAMGTQSRGCRVQILLISDPQNPYYTLNVQRNTPDLIAEEIDTMQFPSEPFEIVAFDWESDGTISNFGIPGKAIFEPIVPISSAVPRTTVESPSLASTYSSQGTTVESPSLGVSVTIPPGIQGSISLVPTPSMIIMSQPPESSSPDLLYIIIGCVVGAVVLLLVAIVVINVIICAKRRSRKGDFEFADKRNSRSPSHVYFKEPSDGAEPLPPVIYEAIPAAKPGKQELVPSPTYTSPSVSLNLPLNSEYEVMSPSYKAQVRYAVPIGRPVDSQTETENVAPVYEVISTKRGVANGTSHATNGNTGVYMVASNPQYGETVAMTSRSDGGVFAVAQNPQYGEPTSRSDGGMFIGVPPYHEPPVPPQSAIPLSEYVANTSRSDSGVVTSPFSQQYSGPTSSSASGVVTVAPNPQYGEITTSHHSISNV